MAFSADGTHQIGSPGMFPNDNSVELSDGNILLQAVEVPGVLTATDSGVAGNVNATVNYKVTFVTPEGETEVGVGTNDLVVTNKKVLLTNIPVSTDTRVTQRKIYRKQISNTVDVVPYYLLVTIDDNSTTTYTDNTADASANALANRINKTGGLIYNKGDIVFSADTENLSIGYDSAYAGTGYASTAVGIHSMPLNSGVRNCAFGYDALLSNTTGENNTAAGVHANNLNVTGSNNSSFGYTALQKATTSNNTAIGALALAKMTSGANTTAIGWNCLGAMSTASSCTAVGYNALGSNNGSFNSAFGSSAGAVTNGGAGVTGAANCTILGHSATLLGATDDNSIVIGRLAQGAGSNTVVIGNSAIVSNTLHGVLILDKTVTAGGTTGAQTINKPIGTVNFAAAATSLVVTNSFVTANSVIHVTKGTNDSTARLGAAVAAAGSFTIFMDVAPAAETRVNFMVVN